MHSVFMLLFTAAAGIVSAAPSPQAIAFQIAVTNTSARGETIPYQYGTMFEVSIESIA